MAVKNVSASFRKAVNRFEKAAVDLSWIGSQPLQNHAGIKEEYKAAKEALLKKGVQKERTGLSYDCNQADAGGQ